MEVNSTGKGNFLGTISFINKDKLIELKLPEVKLTGLVCVAFDSMRIAGKLWGSCGWKASWKSFSAQSS